MNAKELLVKTAASLQLDACGAASVNFSEKLSERLTEAGTIPFAPADIKERIDTEALLPGSRSFFVILFPYRPSHKEEGNIALYARGLDYHKMIQSYLDRIIGVMRNAYPEARFRGLADTSPMVDRWLAYAAGLGFFGKNHCIINPKYGSFFTIGSILTTLELSPDSPLDLSCGECRECFYHCPGHVICEDSFDVWHCKSQGRLLFSAVMNASSAARSTRTPPSPLFPKSGKTGFPSLPVRNWNPIPTVPLTRK